MSFTKCGTCHTWSNSFRTREQHMGATGHRVPLYECDKCEQFFSRQQYVWDHMDDTDHWNCNCDVCRMGFSREDECDQHEIDECRYCRDCDRHFQEDNNMRMHRNSRVHRGTDLACPFCKSTYTSATGLCHHLERGACPRAPSLDRDTVYKIVRSKDPRGAISKNLLGWNGSPTYEANSNAWNGSGYECYICHRAFNSLHGLNQHLSSPAHQQALYHCPNRNGCGKDFVSLASLMNHLESESCGYTRFEKVQNGFRNVLGGDRLIGF